MNALEAARRGGAPGFAPDGLGPLLTRVLGSHTVSLGEPILEADVAPAVITQVRFENLRTIKSLTLDLEGLTVLIGENGTGKSTILEGIELLRKAANPSFVDEFFQVHGGFPSLLRSGESELKLGVTVRDGSNTLSWDATLIRLASGGLLISREVMQGVEDGKRRPTSGYESRSSSANRLKLGQLGERDSAAPLLDCLRRIQVYTAFETAPSWAGQELKRPSPLRETHVFQPAERLARHGANIANAYHALKNEFGKEHWDETMELVRLGLGDDVSDLGVRADPGGGNVALTMWYRGQSEAVPVFSMSDGTLAYLGFVALFRLDSRAALIGFDEPENHLHPKLLMRVLSFFETLAKNRPVLLATHQDRLLDGLEDPASAARLLSLNAARELEVHRPDRGALDTWLEKYRGLGDVRAAGYEASVFKPDPKGS